MKKFIAIIFIMFVSFSCQHTKDMSSARKALDRAKDCEDVKKYAAVELLNAEDAYRKAQRSQNPDDVYVAQRKAESALGYGLLRKTEEEVAAAQGDLDAKLAADAKAREEALKKQLAEEEEAARLARLKEEEMAKAEEELKKAMVGIGEVKKEERGLVLYISDILFDFGKADLNKGTVEKLGTISDVLKKYPQYSLKIEGHTDSVGSDAYNMKLSVKRAEMVSNFLISHGVDAKNVSAEGFGETKPLATNDTPEGRQRNRRVEIVLAQ